MTARENVLARIRGALGTYSPLPEIPRDYLRTDDARGSLTLLTDRLEDYHATVHQVPAEQVPDLLSHIARGRFVVPMGFPEAWLIGVEAVRDEPPLSAAALDALAGVATTCALAIAETGTVVLDGGPGQGRRALSLVPDHHVLVVRAEQVVATVPQALARLDPVRPQTWISGPSATSDIELQRVEGVHGPRRLEVVLIDGFPPVADAPAVRT